MPEVPLISVIGLLALRARGLDLHNHAERLSAAIKTRSSPDDLLADRQWMDAALRATLRPDAIERATADLTRWQHEYGATAVGIGGEGYPPSLLHLYDPPPVLFFQGQRSLAALPALTLGVVGSRNCDRPGAEIAETLASDLARRGVCIVSGLALGIDAAAHRGALAGRATPPTVAVLGSGLAVLHPRTNIPLAQEIVRAGGLLVSEFEPHEPPYPRNFLRRNRILAALSKGVLVIQAGDASGSLVTARHALDLGRDVMVVPGDIRDPRYAGSNRLLKQGAHLVTAVSDIEAIFPALPPVATAGVVLHPEEVALLRALAAEPRTRTEVRKLLSPTTECEGLLLDLELRGLIAGAPGDRVELTALAVGLI